MGVLCVCSKSHDCKQVIVERKLTATSRLAELSTPPSRCHSVRREVKEEEELGIENSDFK